MKTTLKDAGFALFFLVVIALVAVEAAESSDGESRFAQAESRSD